MYFLSDLPKTPLHRQAKTLDEGLGDPAGGCLDSKMTTLSPVYYRDLAHKHVVL